METQSIILNKFEKAIRKHLDQDVKHNSLYQLRQINENCQSTSSAICLKNLYYIIIMVVKYYLLCYMVVKYCGLRLLNKEEILCRILYT